MPDMRYELLGCKATAAHLQFESAGQRHTSHKVHAITICELGNIVWAAAQVIAQTNEGRESSVPKPCTSPPALRDLLHTEPQSWDRMNGKLVTAPLHRSCPRDAIMCSMRTTITRPAHCTTVTALFAQMHGASPLTINPALTFMLPYGDITAFLHHTTVLSCSILDWEHMLWAVCRHPW
jgi:hypothetical protein